MLVYSDLALETRTLAALDEIPRMLDKLAAEPPGITRHATLVSAFIAMGELAQGMADAAFAACGADDRSPAQDSAMAVLMRMADAVHRSWNSEFKDQPSLPPDLLEELSNTRLPDKISINRPEGYAFYALYPESYLRAASLLGRDHATRVIGIRSIGTGLAALVASALGAPAPITLRPTGDPFRREVKVADELEAELLRDLGVRFAIVDEGPGLSGSSFGAVADWLEAKGVARDRLHFFPSHTNELGPKASAAHHARWRSAHRHVVAFDDLVLCARCPMHRLEAWVADLIGPPEEPLEDISGGGWRARYFSDETNWPPSHVQQERRKFLLRTGGSTWLLKFAGLGRGDAEKLDVARRLHAAGFAPEPAGYCHGFLIERWIDDARPLSLAAVDRGNLVKHLGSYIGFRARAFPAEQYQGASPHELFRMARHNTASGLDEEFAEALDPWCDRLHRLQGDARRVRTDNRLHPWEWRQSADGRLIKTDALDHHAAHDLVGCQHPAWDIAGAGIEFDLSDDERDELCKVFEQITEWPVSGDLLSFHEVCYAAFQLGYWSLAADALAGFPAEALRTRAAADRYRRKLRQILQRL